MDRKARSYKDLLVWQKAVELAVQVYEITRLFPETEKYGLTAQIRRAAISVPSNIAEGQARRTQDFKRFLGIASGSLYELETQLLISRKLGYLKELDHAKLEDKTREISKMLHGLSSKLNTSH